MKGQDEDNRKGRALKRILVTVLSLVGVSGVVAILTYLEDQKDRERDRRDRAEEKYKEREQELAEEITSSISGRIFHRTTNEPLGNVWVGYQSRGGFVHVTTTDPEGVFHMEVMILDDAAFPIRIMLQSPNWGRMTYQTNEYLKYGEKRVRVNIFINPENPL